MAIMTHELLNGRIVTLDDSMVVDLDEHIAPGEYNPHNVRAWAIGHEFGCLAIVFAEHEADAVDKAVDAGKLDCLRIPDDKHACEEDCEAMHAGNADEPFDQSYLWVEELPNFTLSWVASFTAYLAAQEAQ